MQLIITEKGSLADSVANGLKLLGEKPIKKEGVYCSNHYVIAPAQGHLFELQDLEDYLELGSHEKPSWNKTYEVLKRKPFIPKEFKFHLKPDKVAKAKYATIKKWIHDTSITSIINCGDADREGEIIVRLILQNAKNTKPVYRLWLPDQAPSTVAEAIRSMKKDSDYDLLANAGYARTYDDWIRGILGTRIATIKSNTLIRYGRVKGAIIKIIYDREMEIRNFIPRKYIGITSKVPTKGVTIELNSSKTFDLNESKSAQDLAGEYNKSGAIVQKVEKKKRVIARPKFFNQSDIQNAMNKAYGIAPKETLQTVQSLYDQGYVTYPRTASQYMATAEKDKAKKIIQAICKRNPVRKLVYRDTKQIFDDTKIESHSGITPTVQIPEINKLKDIEKKCYQLIMDRFCAVFAEEDCIGDDTVLTIECDGEIFKVKGTSYTQLGWKVYDRLYKANDTLVPDLKEGDTVIIDFHAINKQTQPAKRYTVTTLNRKLITPFTKQQAEDESENNDDTEEIKAIMEGSTIGTEATRAGIIDECIRTGYLKLDRSTYYLTQDGENYIQVLKDLKMEPDIQDTVSLNKHLTDVLKGTMTIEEVIHHAAMDVQKQYSNAESLTIATKDIKTNEVQQALCTCPKCREGKIIDHNKAWVCTNCGFMVWKDNALFKKLKKPLNKTLIKKMCLSPQKSVVSGFTSKNGKKFDANIEMDTTGKYANYRMSFNK